MEVMAVPSSTLSSSASEFYPNAMWQQLCWAQSCFIQQMLCASSGRMIPKCGSQVVSTGSQACDILVDPGVSLHAPANASEHMSHNARVADTPVQSVSWERPRRTAKTKTQSKLPTTLLVDRWGALSDVDTDEESIEVPSYTQLGPCTIRKQRCGRNVKQESSGREDHDPLDRAIAENHQITRQPPDSPRSYDQSVLDEAKMQVQKMETLFCADLDIFQTVEEKHGKFRSLRDAIRRQNNGDVNKSGFLQTIPDELVLSMMARIEKEIANASNSTSPSPPDDDPYPDVPPVQTVSDADASSRFQDLEFDPKPSSSSCARPLLQSP